MVLLKNLSLKNIVLTAITLVVALFAILSLVFGVYTETVEFLGEKETFATSGFEYLFGNELYSGWDINVFAAILCLIVFIAAIAIIGLFCAVFVLAKDEDTYKRGLRLVNVATCVSAVIYLIAGIVAASELNVGTAAFVPLIIVGVLTAGYFVADKMLKD